MNYIAHIHLAHHTNTHFAGSVLGDFVKGNHWQTLDMELQTAVKLHRWVDQFTDKHVAVKSLLSLFPKSVRRYAGIAIDIYFDHLLVSQWQDFESLEINTLFTRFYQQLANTNPSLTLPKFELVKSRLLKHRWLSNYSDEETCLQAMRTIEKRSRYRFEFADECFATIKNKQQDFSHHFKMFYPELMNMCHSHARTFQI